MVVATVIANYSLPQLCYELYLDGAIYDFPYEDYFGGEQFLGENS